MSRWLIKNRPVSRLILPPAARINYYDACRWCRLHDDAHEANLRASERAKSALSIIMSEVEGVGVKFVSTDEVRQGSAGIAITLYLQTAC